MSEYLFKGFHSNFKLNELTCITLNEYFTDWKKWSDRLGT
jgi:hypothetical protein